MTKKSSKFVDVEMCLPTPVVYLIDKLAAEGLLGDTREEVVIFMLRHFVFHHQSFVPK